MTRWNARAPLVRSVIVASLVASSSLVSAQDLEPKAYSASPAGAMFLVAGFSRSSGSVLTDPTLPLTDVNAKINGVPLAAGYTFGLFGKLALVTVAIPVAWGEVTGQVFEEARTVTRSGLTDSRVKLSVNLVGNPAVGAREFVKAPRKAIVGTSFTAVAPTGQYDGTKLINLGTPLGVQAGDRRLGAEGTVGFRRLPGRVALPGQR